MERTSHARRHDAQPSRLLFILAHDFKPLARQSPRLAAFILHGRRAAARFTMSACAILIDGIIRAAGHTHLPLPAQVRAHTAILEISAPPATVAVSAVLQLRGRFLCLRATSVTYFFSDILFTRRIGRRRPRERASRD